MVKKPTPTTASKVIPAPKINVDWRAEIFSININEVHKNRTCQLSLLAENCETNSTALNYFYYGAEFDKLDVVKPLSFADLLVNIKKYSKDESDRTNIHEILISCVAKEALKYLQNGLTIPCNLIAYLIKLQIVTKTLEDVALTQRNILISTNLQKERDALIETVASGSGKKGGAAKGGKKGSDKDSKKSKKGSEVKGYNVCNPGNILNFKTASKLQPINLQLLSVNNTITIPDKHLYFVMIGFYDFELIQELFLLGVPLIGIVKFISNNHDSYTAKDTFQLNNENVKGNVLSKFWKKIDNAFESDLYPDYIENSIYMTINADLCHFNDDDKRNCKDLFIFIRNEIVKFEDIIRQHVNYVRHLKIIEVGPKPKYLPKSNYQLYESIMEKLPPDCFTVSFLSYALIEQVSALVPNLNTSKLKTSVSTSSEIFIKNIIKKKDPSIHNGVKNSLAFILNKNINIHSLQKTVTTNYETEFLISRKPFLIHEHNDIELMVSPYENISFEFSKICINSLKKCFPVLLWKVFPNIEQSKALINKYNLLNICKTLNIPLYELQYFIYTIFFNYMKCQICSNKCIEDECICELYPSRISADPGVEEIQVTDFPTKNLFETITSKEYEVNLPYVNYLNCPNIFEAKNVATYKWYESLSETVMLQQLNKCQQQYLCCDYKYCPVDDTILLRYHNNLDSSGINIKVWNQPIRTVVGLKEFFKYIVNEDADWVKKEESKYMKRIEKEINELHQKQENLKEAFYPKLVFTDTDFIQPGSLKANKILTESQKSQPLQLPKGGKKGAKEKAKPKKEGSKGKKGKPGASTLETLEQLSRPILPEKKRKESLHVATEKPYSFFAYDLCNHRLQLIGHTIVFNSQDDMKVVVDQTRLSKQLENLSMNVFIRDHCLTIHKNQKTFQEPFTFHLTLPDQTVLAFAKPPRVVPIEEKIADKICQATKRQNVTNTLKKQELYFISEQQNHILKCFKIPLITKKKLILTEELLEPFLQQLNRRGIKLKFTPSKETLNSQEINKIEEVINASSKGSKTRSISSISTKLFPLKHVYGVITKSVSSLSKNVSEVNEGYEEPLIQLRKSFLSITSNSDITKASAREILNNIKTAIESHLPIFKICSTRLHRYSYVKRIKSFVNVQVGPILKRFIVKPPIYKGRRNLEVAKLLPLKLLPPRSNLKYDLRFSLPSGLFIQNMYGTNGMPFYIKQGYLETGPQCRNIADESFRTFLRNGTILIKYYNGNISILDIKGQIVNCDIPYLKVGRSKHPETNDTKKRTKYKTNLIPLYAHTSSLTKFQKYLKKIIHRFENHLIDGPRSHCFRSHSVCKRWKYAHIKDASQVFVLRQSSSPLTKFSLITKQGNKLKITESRILEEKKYYTATTTDYQYEEILYEREDGTHSILHRDSQLVTQFPDQTRISSWIDIAPNLLVVIEEPSKCANNMCTEEQQTHDFNENSSSSISTDAEKQSSSGWVSVFLNYKYEHPNFATVIYYGMDNHMEMILPNDIEIEISEEGKYSMLIGKSIHAHISTDMILLEAWLCASCLQKCTVSLNVKPLYYKIVRVPHETELLRAVDSFRKIFIVKYNGKCYINKKLNTVRTNAVDCKNHTNAEFQKLFVLRRNLNGCQFWNINAYQNRMMQSKNDNNSSVEFPLEKDPYNFNSTTFKRYVKIPREQVYLLPFAESNLVLTKFKTELQAAKYCYVTKQVLKSLPQFSVLSSVYKILKEIQNKIITFPNYKEFNIFLNQIFAEHDLREREKLEIWRLGQIPVVIEEKEPIIPLADKIEHWRVECNRYLNEIRSSYVPSYFTSKYVEGYTDPNLKEREEQNMKAADNICDCYFASSGEAILMSNVLCDEMKTDQVYEIHKKIVENVEDSKSDYEFKVNKSVLHDTQIGKAFLNEVKQKLVKCVGKMEIITPQKTSSTRVAYVTEKIFNNILYAIELNQVNNSSIPIAADLIVKRILKEQLNTLEMKLLLSNIEEETKEPSDVSKLCVKMKTVTAVDCYSQFQFPKASSTKLIINKLNDDSAFGVYSTYSDKFVKEISKEQSESHSLSDKHSSSSSRIKQPDISKVSRISQPENEKLETIFENNSDNIIAECNYGRYSATNGSIQYDIPSFLTETSDYSLTISSSERVQPNFIIGSESSILDSVEEESLMEKDDVIEIDSKTNLLNVDKLETAQSKLVLFSLCSLLDKDNKKPIAGPFVHRNPSEIENNMKNVLKVTDEELDKDNITKMKDERRCSVDENTFQKCKKCILKNKSFIEYKDTTKLSATTLRSISDVIKKVKSGILPVTDKAKMDPSLQNILEEAISTCPEKTKTKINIAKISDADAKFLKANCPRTFQSKSVLTPTPVDKKNVVQKTEGTITQPGTTDNASQT